MKSYRHLIAAFVAACFFTVAAFAADPAPAASSAASPAGTWKWTQAGRGGAPGVERSLKLDYKEGKLTGTLMGAQMGNFQIPDVAIADGSFKDGAVSFTVTNDFNGTKRTSKYEGKLDGDTIKGSIERPGRDGAVQKQEWNATRAK